MRGGHLRLPGQARRSSPVHFEPKSIKQDQRRNNRSIVGGYLVLRYYYEDVIHRPEAMVAEVQAVLRVWRRPTNSRLGDLFA